MATTSKDPRTIITPDAFSVDPPLLGTPLARPWRRGVALLIDIFLVGLITALTSGIGFVIGVVAAAFFFNRATKSDNSEGGSKMFRFFLGCLGVMALSLTTVVVLGIWYVNSATDDFVSDSSIEQGADAPLQSGSSGGASGDDLRALLGGLQEGAQLRSTDDPDEAVALAVGVGRRLLELAPQDDLEDVENLLRELIPQEVGDVGGEEIRALAMVQLDSTVVEEATASPAANLPSDQAGAAVAGPGEMELAEALDLAGDTIEELEEGLARANRDLEDTRDELDEALEQQGVSEWVTSRLDSFGFGFGWWALYFAILMPRMKGQTPGKRAMGVRVVRLDGHPVTWWHAFERAGGYAAGLATGTLGFLQIYWDANRQAIHDKVAGTVVIRDGVAKVPGNWDRQVTGTITHPSAGDPT